MKLSPEQIAQIDETLVLNKVDYDDIKLELTDHIASDVEAIMNDEKIPFDEAFKKALLKWREEFKPISKNLVFWGFENTPRIIRVKFVNQTKKQLLFIVLTSLILTSLVYETIKNNNVFFSSISKVYFVNYVIIAVLGALSKKSIEKSNKKTTFSYLFKANYFLIFFAPIIQGGSIRYSQFFDPNSYFDIAYLLLSNIILCFGLFTLYLVYKHFQFEKKLSKV